VRMDDVHAPGRPECRKQSCAATDFDACIAETLRERATGPGDQHLFVAESLQSTDQQFGLAFPTAIAFRQVDVCDSHRH